MYFDNLDVTINESRILEKSDYYPFGLTFNSYKKGGMIGQNFKYNGKEEINDLGVDWIDYHARQYDPSLGRMLGIDPLADNYSIISPYAYAINNPIAFIDPDGREVKNAHEEEYQSTKKDFESVKAKTKGVNKKEWSKAQKKEFRSARSAYNNAASKYDAAQNAIEDLKSTDEGFFNQLDNLTDPNGDNIDVFVGVTSSGERATSGDKEISGETQASPNNEQGIAYTKFTSQREPYYVPYSSHGKGTIGIKIPSTGNRTGKLLAHEGGHAHYLAKKLFYYYRIYLKKHPYSASDFEIGHRAGDPNGEAAREAERRYSRLKRKK